MTESLLRMTAVSISAARSGSGDSFIGAGFPLPHSSAPAAPVEVRGQ